MRGLVQDIAALLAVAAFVAAIALLAGGLAA